MLCYSKHVANDILIMSNKFVSQIIKEFYNLYYYYYPNTQCNTSKLNIVE